MKTAKKKGTGERSVSHPVLVREMARPFWGRFFKVWDRTTADMKGEFKKAMLAAALIDSMRAARK